MSLNSIRNDIRQVERCISSTDGLENDIRNIESKLRQDENQCQNDWEGKAHDAYKEGVNELESLLSQAKTYLKKNENELRQLKRELEQEYRYEKREQESASRNSGSQSSGNQGNQSYSYYGGRFEF